MDFDNIKKGDIIFVQDAHAHGRDRYKHQPALVRVISLDISSNPSRIHAVAGSLEDPSISNEGYREYFYYRDEVLDPPRKKVEPRKNLKSKIIGKEVIQW